MASIVVDVRKYPQRQRWQFSLIRKNTTVRVSVTLEGNPYRNNNLSTGCANNNSLYCTRDMKTVISFS